MYTQRNALRSVGYLLGSIVLAGCGGGGGGGNNMAAPQQNTPLANDSIAVTSSNRILSFNRTTPGTTTAMAVTGLQTGEMIMGIDTRPADGNIYALTNANRMYIINPTTGAATLRSQLMADPTDTSSPFNGINGATFGTNFNPVVDRLRVISNTGQNLRINVDTGTVITDAPLTTGTSGNMRMGVTAVAYTGSFSSTCRTTVTLIDTTNGQLLTSPNLTNGMLNTVGSLGATVSATTAYDIVTDSTGTDNAVVIGQMGGTTQLATINLSSGAVSGGTALAGLNAGESVTGLAISRPTMEPSQTVGNMLGLTASNRIISFNTASPRRLCTSAQVTGLQANETLLDIDTRPSDGQLYALGNSGRIYTVNTTTGAATVRSTLSAPLSGVEFGFQFNPIADAARLISDNGQNIVINVDTGAVTPSTSLNPQGFVANSLAYTNGFAGTSSIIAYVLDSQGDQLLGLGQSSGLGAGNGDLNVIGPLNLGDTGSVAALEIVGTNNMAFAANNIAGASTSELDSINLMTGAGTRVDTIGGSERVRGLAVTSVPQSQVVAATTDGRIVTFAPLTPGTFTNNNPVTGLAAGESLIGLDYRPANGLLYGLGSTGKLYLVNATTGAASGPVSLSADPTDTTAPFTSLMGAAFGFDFNPVVDRTRTFSDVEENLRGNADNGTVITDGTLNRAPFSVTANAYTNSVSPATTTTLYDIDTTNDVLLTQSPQNAGILFPVGPLGVDAGAVNGFEIVGTTTGTLRAFAALSVANGPSTLYTINLSTGKATAVGAIATLSATDRITGLSSPPNPNPAANIPVFAIVNGVSLMQFPLNAPNTASTARTITGLQTGEQFLGVDYRPADGQLYGLTNQNRVYVIDTNAAAATATATSLTMNGAAFTLTGTNFGIDFSPLADAIRVASDQGANLAITVTGTVTVATSLNFTQPDIVAVGYTSNYSGALSTRALVLDASTSATYVVNPTVNGTIVPLGILDPALTFSKTAAFDIVGGTDGLSLAAVQPTTGGQSTLYRVNPLTGNGTVIGPVGPGGTQAVSAMAILLQ